jgi:hypothetical protein
MELIKFFINCFEFYRFQGNSLAVMKLTAMSLAVMVMAVMPLAVMSIDRG